jgi:DNA polymerase-3 subunit beta
MKLTVEKDALVRALGRLHRIVERRTTIPILSNVLLSGDGSTLSLRATDLDMEATDTVPADVSEPGSTSVPAHVLNDIVKKLPDGGQVSLSVEAGESRLHLRSGRSRFQLPSLPPGDFPSLESGDLPFAFDLARADLRRLFEKVQASISTEETRYYLNGVYLHVVTDAEGAQRMKAVATDGHRLGLATIPAPAGSEGMPGVIVPRKAVTEVLRLADDSVETIPVEVSKTKIRMRFGSVVVVSKLIDGTFPDYARVIPTGNDKVLVAERAALSAAINRVSSVSVEKGRAIGLAIAPGTAVLTVNSPDAGSATEEFAVEYDDAPLTIGFNWKYLIEVLAAFEGERVEALLGDAGNPVIVRTPGGGDLLYVLMPMRV